MNNNKNMLETEHALKILKEIESNPKITQRNLSKNLNISLGKINFLINSLIQKGWIEIKNFKNSQNKLVYAYLLTPEGLKKKIHFCYQFLSSKEEEYNKLRRELETLKKEITSIEQRADLQMAGEAKITVEEKV